MATCQFKKKDGSRCKASSLVGKKFCFAHSSPNSWKKAQRKGGQQNRRKVLPEGVFNNAPLRSMEALVEFLEGIIYSTMSGYLDHKIANTVGFLCNTLLRAIEGGELEKRIEKLEGIIRRSR